MTICYALISHLHEYEDELHVYPSSASLRAFLEVARMGSFTEASRNLNLSQPALSRTIRILEEQLGVRLFDRNTRNVVITPAGADLHSVVERLALDFEQAFSELHRTFIGQRGRVVVGALPSIAAGILPRLIADFREAMPQVDVQIRDGLAGTLENLFEERQIDLALIAVEHPPLHLDFHELAREPFGLLCRKGSSLDVQAPAEWSTLLDNPYIAMARSSSVRTAADAGLVRAGLSPHPLYECAHVTTVAGLVRASLGVSAIPRSTLTLMGEQGLAWRPLVNPPVERIIGLAKVPERTLAPAASAFERHIVDRYSSFIT